MRPSFFTFSWNVSYESHGRNVGMSSRLYDDTLSANKVKLLGWLEIFLVYSLKIGLYFLFWDLIIQIFRYPGSRFGCMYEFLDLSLLGRVNSIRPCPLVRLLFRPSLSISMTVHNYYLIICMKVGHHNGIKVTEPGFWKKIFWGSQMRENPHFGGIFEVFRPYLCIQLLKVSEISHTL